MIVQIIFFTCAAILFITVAAVIWIRNEKSIIGPRNPTDGERDFLETMVDKKKQKLARNTWGMKLSTYIAIGISTSIIGGAFCYYLTGNIMLVVVVAAIGFLAPEVVETVRENKERMKFEERYARSLRQLSASLKAGLSIAQAVTDITESHFIHDSVRSEFVHVDSDLKLGMSVHEAFDRFAKRVKTHDAMDVATAISMQQQVGGNTSLVVEVIAKDINTRILSRKEIKSLFAGTASTIMMMDIMPMAIIALIAISSPNYFQPFFESIITTIVFWGLIAVTLVGSYIIRKIIRRMKDDCNV